MTRLVPTEVPPTRYPHHMAKRCRNNTCSEISDNPSVRAHASRTGLGARSSRRHTAALEIGTTIPTFEDFGRPHYTTHSATNADAAADSGATGNMLQQSARAWIQVHPNPKRSLAHGELAPRLMDISYKRRCTIFSQWTLHRYHIL